VRPLNDDHERTGSPAGAPITLLALERGIANSTAMPIEAQNAAQWTGEQKKGDLDLHPVRVFGDLGLDSIGLAVSGQAKRFGHQL
jgi:hypothetical protein